MTDQMDVERTGTVWSSIPGTNIKSGWVYVTPEIAKLYLLANTANRNIREKHVKRIVSDMEADRFDIHHQGVAFDENNVLLDGQHRMKAIIESGKAQWMLVTLGLPVDSKKVVDTGAKRKAADFMPGKFRDIRAAALRVLLAVSCFDDGFTISELSAAMTMITNADIQEHWDAFNRNFDMEEILNLANEASRNVAICGPAALAASALIYPTRGLEFLEGLRAMTGLQHGDPRLALLKARNNGRVQSPTSAFVAIKVAKFFNARRQLTVLRYSNQETLKL